jgi:hypothetical protein
VVELHDEVLVAVAGDLDIRAAASRLPGADLPVTVATSSALAAAVLQAIGASLIRVQLS